MSHQKCNYKLIFCVVVTAPVTLYVIELRIKKWQHDIKKIKTIIVLIVSMYPTSD